MKFESIGNIVTIHKGKKHEITDEYTALSRRVLQIDDLRNDNQIKYTNDEKGVLATEDDLMIAWDGANAGTIGYGKGGYIGSTIAVLRKKQPVKYSTIFLGKFLQSQFAYLRKNATGATIPHIDRKSLESLKVPVIDISDQLHIANLLSKVEDLIKQRKESIRLLDEFLKSTFLEMFGDPLRNEKGWEKMNLKSISTRFSDGPFGSNLKTEHYSENGIQVIRLQNIGVNKFNEDDISYVNESHYVNVLKKYTCLPGDVVIATMGTPNVRACIIPKHVKISINKADCVLCRVNQEIVTASYISYLLNQDGFLHLASSFMHGQTRTRISSGQLAQISICIPPLPLQTQFAQIVEKTEALKVQYKSSLLELENLYRSLSQQAFSPTGNSLQVGKGELTAKEYKIEEEKLGMVAEGEEKY